MGDRHPVCGNCGRGIRPCAPCCRHTGWVHRRNGRHDCGEEGAPAGTMARPDIGKRQEA